MYRGMLGLAVVVGMSLVAAPCRAQVGNLGADPFSLYFGYYLPHQAAIAAQPTPMDTINAAQAARQVTAAADRTGLYDPISPFDDDPLRPYARGRERIAPPHRFATSTVNHVMRGVAPRTYFNRTQTGATQYYATLRYGQGPNRNLAATRAPNRIQGMNGGYGFPSMNPQAYTVPQNTFSSMAPR